MQPPVALRRPVAQINGGAGAVGRIQLELLEKLLLGPLRFFGRHAVGSNFFYTVENRLEHDIRLDPLGDFGGQHQGARVVHRISATRHARGLSSFDQRFVEPTGGRRRENAFENVNRSEVGVPSRRNVVQDPHDRHVAHASQRHEPFAVLRRFFGVWLFEDALGTGNRSEILGDRGQRLVLVETPGDDQHGVVGLIVLRVKPFEALDRNPFDVGPIADRRLAVIVPLERDREHSIRQHLCRHVLAPLELVADDGHFRLQVLAFHETVDHPVGLQVNGELQVVVVGRQRLVIVRPVKRGGAVEVRPARLQQLGHRRVGRRPFEEHVLQQVGHARFAVPLVPRPDENGQVHGDSWFRGVRKQQDFKAVVETILGNSLYGCDFLRRGRFGCLSSLNQVDSQRGQTDESECE